MFYRQNASRLVTVMFTVCPGQLINAKQINSVALLMRAESFKHSLLSVDVGVGIAICTKRTVYVRIFEAKMSETI